MGWQADYVQGGYFTARTAVSSIFNSCAMIMCGGQRDDKQSASHRQPPTAVAPRCGFLSLSPHGCVCVGEAGCPCRRDLSTDLRVRLRLV